jgi:glycyl-tRNA synthetase
MRTLEELNRYCLQYGFFYPTAEIYKTAPSGFWEYGPLGTLLKQKFLQMAMKELIRKDEMTLIDGSQILPRDVFLASGHLNFFTDPLCSCNNCGSIFRADKLIEEQAGRPVPERTPSQEIVRLLQNVKCPSCNGELGNLRLFNMMFKTTVGVNGDEVYLRPETAQNIYISFPRLYVYARRKLPLPVAQIGKSFRNEISPRQSLLRLREFTQLEVEVFYDPNTVNDIEKYKKVKDKRIPLYINNQRIMLSCEEAIEQGYISNWLQAYYLTLIYEFYIKLNIPPEKIRFRELSDDEKAFYARRAWDLEVGMSMGWIELVACNDRGDYDLTAHMKVSGEEMYVPDNTSRLVPHVFELSMGVDRSILSLLDLNLIKENERTVLRLRPALAPITVAVFPLIENDTLVRMAKDVYELLRLDFDAFYDDSGSIGRRYRRQDIIGTPYCITIDFDTLKNQTVTIRERDTMEQNRVEISQIKRYLIERLGIYQV